jgi:hypothetical protein
LDKSQTPRRFDTPAGTAALMGWVLMECPNRDQDTEEKDVVGVLGNGWLVAWQLMHFFLNRCHVVVTSLSFFIIRICVKIVGIHVCGVKCAGAE